MNEKVLQESIFELLTSEASYNNSLNVLQEFIFDSNQFTTYVGRQDTEVLKSNLDQSKCDSQLSHEKFFETKKKNSS